MRYTSVSVRPTTAVPQDSKLLVAIALHELCVGGERQRPDSQLGNG